jgi:hypothetical protein
MATELIRFTQWAREKPQRQYNALMGMLMDPHGLNASFERQAGSKAPGVDGMRKADYAVGLPGRLADLSARLRRLGYRPKPVRRVYIPKANAGRRALGVPSFEDRLVQDRLSGILQAIWEPEFRECSYGFRPQRNAHQALKRLAEVITLERTQWIVDADIKGFFDHVSHYHLQRFLAHRISDPRLLRIIERFLKAGVMEDGVMSASDQGTPQGGLVSPVLANIYLHYSAPGQTWCFQRVKFPSRQEVQPPYRESSLGFVKATTRTKRRQSDERAVTKVKLSNLVKYSSAGRQRSSGWQAPVGSPQMAMVAGDCGGVMSTARSEMEASRDLGDPPRSWFAPRADRVCRTIWLTPENGRRCGAKSDSLVVLRARESRVHGEAAKQMKTGFGDTSPAPTEAGV